VSIFKSYDIRGVWGREWDAGTARAIGRALPGLLRARTAVVGRDARLSSPEAFAELTAGLEEAGCSVADIGVCDTPALYFATARYGFDASVMITASHNPPEYNGLKISRREAVPVGYDTGLAELERLVGSRTPSREPGQPPAAQPRRLDIQADYLAHLARFVDGIRGLRVVIDYSNGTGSVYFPRALAGLAATVIPMFDQPDGRFPNHPPNPLVEANLASLKARVVAERADLGICFDGDADRVMFVDERGSFVSPDLMIGLVGYWYFRMHPERLAGATPVVSVDVRTSRGVVEYLRSLGADPRMCRVGHSHAKRMLRETGGICGGELAGHYYFHENWFCDSGLIAALAVLGVRSAADRPLSDLVRPIGRYAFSGEINFEVAGGGGIVEEIRRRYAGGKLTDIDGIRIDFPTWWFNLRVSNTEPLLRLVVEAETAGELADRRRELEEQIRGLARTR
jgi:phosphomannomutase